jgi:uncharacterized membrane protein
MTRRNSLSLITMLALCAMSFAAPARQQTTYRLTHLGTTVFENDTTVVFGVFGINESNELVGSRPVPGGVIAFIWRDGEFQDLNPLLNTNLAFAEEINERSEVIGDYWDEQQDRFRGFLLRRGEITRIEAVPGEISLLALDINNRPEVLIRSQDAQFALRGFVWRDGHLTPLEPLPGSGTFARRLNDRGAIIGTAFLPATSVPVLWQDATVMQIELPEGAVSGIGMDINNHGAAIGNASFPDIPFVQSGYSAGFLWREGQATELPSPDGRNSNFAWDINNRGVIVGYSFRPSEESVAVIWPRRGDPVDLNELIAEDDPLKPFVHLREGSSINDRGVIVASGFDSRNEYSTSTYLLTPQH